MLHKALILALTISMVAGCAGMNPNPGEQTVDMAWTSGDFERAFAIAKPSAERGEPWAQLRLGIFYENGWGVERNPSLAIDWYERTIAQTGTGGWAEGQMVGSVGKAGTFNQTSDAIIAEFDLAQLLYKGEGIPRNLPKAYLHITNVIRKADGNSVFFCCEFAGGRYFNPTQFAELKSNIEAGMSSDERAQAQVLVDRAHN